MASTSFRRDFAGIGLSPIELPTLLSEVSACLDRRSRLTVTFINPDYARRALRSDSLREDMNRFDLTLVDGNGVRLLTPIFGFRAPARLDTDSVAPSLFRLLASRSSRVFLFGCAPGVADLAGKRLAQSFPGLVIAGTEHGFHDVDRGHPGRFTPADSARIIEDINASAADFLLVSLPTPLQQRWVAQHAGRLQTPLIMTAGSYLDHLTNEAGLAWYPRWADVLRLNWFYRLIREPRRLWRRYTIEIIDFVRLVITARLRSSRWAR